MKLKLILAVLYGAFAGLNNSFCGKKKHNYFATQVS